MGTIITVLCDNSISKSGFVGEHGFSLLLERGNEKVLFDTGPGMSLPLNLKTSNNDLDGLSGVFLSHGHYDHTGGLKWVIQQVGRVAVTAHTAVFSRHMVLDPENRVEPTRYVGCPYTQQELEDLGGMFNLIDHTEEISPGLWFVAGIDRNPQQLPKDTRLVLPQGDGFVPDPIEDDASLLMETGSGPVLILGCAHSGVLNILDHIKEKIGIGNLRAVLGGTHLMFYGPEDIARVINKFEEFSVDLVAVSHCTGMQGVIELSKHFEERFMVASAGSVLNF